MSGSVFWGDPGLCKGQEAECLPRGEIWKG